MEKANSANKRAWIGTTIEAMKAKRDIIGLIKALEHKETDIRGAAAEALGETKHAGAVKFLTKALRDKNWSVRNKAAWALSSNR